MTIEVRDPAPESAYIVPADLPPSNTPPPEDVHVIDRKGGEFEHVEDVGQAEEASAEASAEVQESEEDVRAAKAAAKEAYKRRRAERETQASHERIRALEDQIKNITTSRSPEAREAVNEAPRKPDPKAYPLGRWDQKYEEDLSSWMDARESHILEQASRRAHEATSSISREAAQMQAMTQLTTYADQVEQRGVDKYSDFLDIVQDALEAMPPHQEAVKRLVQLPNAEDVFYHLARKPSELERITGLDPMDQALEFGKISARLAANSKAATSIPKAKPSPKAPRGDSGQFSSESDVRYAKMLKATRTW